MDEILEYLEFGYTWAELFDMIENDSLEDNLIPDLKQEFPEMTEKQLEEVLSNIFTQWELRH